MHVLFITSEFNFLLLIFLQTTRRPDFFEISPRPFSIDDGYRQTPLTFTRGQPSLKPDYYDAGYSGQAASSNRFRQGSELLGGEEINVQQLPSRNRFSSRENTSPTAKLNNRNSNDPFASQNQQQQRENNNVRNSNRVNSKVRGTPTSTTPVPKPVKKERQPANSWTSGRNRRPIDDYDTERDLVRLTEPSIGIQHSINITHNGSDKRQNDKTRLEKEELQYHDENADYIYEDPVKSVKPLKQEKKPIDNKDKLEDESKYYSSPKNNVELSKNKHDDTEIDDIQEHEEQKPKIDEHTVILTDNFFLPPSKTSENEPEEEYIYEYEYEDETEEPPETSHEATSSPVTQASSTKNVVKSLDEISSTEAPLKSVVKSEESVSSSVSNSSDNQEENPNTTESWVVVASVQTSRSVSGARFLPLGVKQEEKKAPLTELEALAKLNEELEHKKLNSKESLSSVEDSPVITTEISPPETTILDTEILESSTIKTTSTSISTESINDKLDSIQSELSSGVLSGKFPVLKEMTTQEPQPITTKSPPVFIRKFSPKARPDQIVTKTTTTTTTTTEAPTTSTTQVPKAESKKIVIEDDLTGLLPADFKPRYQGYKKKGATSTTTTTTTTSTTETPSVNRINNTRSFKNSPSEQSISFVEDDVAKFLPKDFKLNKPESKVAVVDDIDKFLPPGYKKQLNTKTEKPLPVIPIQDDILSKLLPKGYNVPSSQKAETTTKKIVNSPVDISKLLPPGYKPPQEDEEKETENNKESQKVIPLEKEDLFAKLLKKSQSALDALLPPDFTPEPETTTPTTTSTTAGGFVFPKRPGGNKSAKDNDGPKRAKGPPPPKIDIKRGPPTRATTEFTGWPTVATTPISIEKLLANSGGEKIDIASLFNKALGNVNGNTGGSSFDSQANIPDSPFSLPTTTTTTTSTTTVKPTEPGICQTECDLAGTIRIVDGVKWRPELLDHNTDEWKNLAKEVKQELNEVFIKSDKLRRWYKTLRIDSFSKGSVLVDYFVELDDISDEVNTLQIKGFFHDALTPTKLPESIQNDTMDERQSSAVPQVKETFIFDSQANIPDSPFSLPTTTTTTTSTTTVKPTEPGICQTECDLAGTIRIVDGVKWRPELLDHNTDEWKNLAKEVKQELNEVFIKSDKLRRWYKTLRIDSFSKGSVLVDYFVELDDISDEVNTLQIKGFFHDALTPTKLPESIQNDTMDERQSSAVPQVKETFMLGKFVLDPISTDFIVQHKPVLASGPETSEALLPQWAIAVIVMSFFSLLFVILFGVAVLISRQRAAKKKGPVPLTAAMLNELNKNHMGGIDNYGNEELYNVDDGWGDEKEPPYVSRSKHSGWADEKEPPYSKHEFKSKRLNGGSIYGSSATNIYDSWGSARNPPRGADYYDDSGYDPYSHRSTYSRDYMMHEPPALYPYHKHEKYDYRSSRRNHRDYDPNF
uniref:CSON000951 protein n=1 Tax=Culicoides sonorensis TaxID=179676 RepID=A0A336KX75_CULSO